MRKLWVLGLVLTYGAILSSQELAPGCKLCLGTPKSAFLNAFGKPFGPMRVSSGDDNAMIGVPVGLWSVYHLTAQGDRMYVTMIHFGALSRNTPTSQNVIDSVMLMPADKVTVAQILKDQPAFTSVCTQQCEMALIKNKFGNPSLLLIPKAPHANALLYFEGDSATKEASVTSPDSVVSWAYLLLASEFRRHHDNFQERVSIGTWPPDMNSQN